MFFSGSIGCSLDLRQFLVLICISCQGLAVWHSGSIAGVLARLLKLFVDCVPRSSDAIVICPSFSWLEPTIFSQVLKKSLFRSCWMNPAHISSCWCHHTNGFWCLHRFWIRLKRAQELMVHHHFTCQHGHHAYPPLWNKPTSYCWLYCTPSYPPFIAGYLVKCPNGIFCCLVDRYPAIEHPSNPHDDIWK